MDHVANLFNNIYSSVIRTDSSRPFPNQGWGSRAGIDAQGLAADRLGLASRVCPTAECTPIDHLLQYAHAALLTGGADLSGQSLSSLRVDTCSLGFSGRN